MSFLDRFRRKPKSEEPASPPESRLPAADANVPKQDKHPAANKPAPGAPGASKGPPPADELRLELGDFLHRIPAQMLLPGPHDLKTELRFDIHDLSQRIARGNTSIALAEIYRRVPHIFRAEVLETDNVEVRFPWQKLAKLVGKTKPVGEGAPVEGGDEALAERLRIKKPPKPGTRL